MPCDRKAQLLVAVGAAVAANCQRCVEACMALARQSGADEGDIRTAAAIGVKIMGCAARASGAVSGSAVSLPDIEAGSDAGCAWAQVESQEGGSV